LGGILGKVNKTAAIEDFGITFSCSTCKKEEKGSISIQSEPAHGTLVSQLKRLNGPKGWEKFGSEYKHSALSQPLWYCPTCAELRGTEELLKA
jgi:hypothetical protein